MSRKSCDFDIIACRDPDDEDDDEPDDPDAWQDHAEDKQTTDDERADFEGWPLV